MSDDFFWFVLFCYCNFVMTGNDEKSFTLSENKMESICLFVCRADVEVTANLSAGRHEKLSD